MSSSHVQTLANSIIGTAILAMPYCFAKVRKFRERLAAVIFLMFHLFILVWCHFINIPAYYKHNHH